jgi:DNA-binding Lrp family transcriptional regulator
MNDLDRRIINNLQGGFPLSERPFLEAAQKLGIGERELIDRLEHLLEAGVLSRFGPMYHAERLGGGLTLAALAAPAERFDAVAELVNAHPEVAHNYQRDHALNMWFVIATERPGDIDRVLAEIAAETGLVVHDMRKLEEFFVGLRFEA